MSNGQKGRFKIKVWLNKDGEPPDEPSNSKDDKEESSSSFMGDSGDSSDGISKGLVQNDDENDENSTIENVQEKVQNNNDPSKMPSPPSLSSTINSEEPEKCPNCDKMIDPYQTKTLIQVVVAEEPSSHSIKFNSMRNPVKFNALLYAVMSKP